MRRRLLPCLLAATALAAGCYHQRAYFPDTASPATEPQSEVRWSYCWGLCQQEVRDPPCPSHSLYEVTVSTNLAFTLLTVATLGFASPAQIEWRCAKLPSPGL